MKPVFDDDAETEELESGDGDRNSSNLSTVYQEFGEEFNGFSQEEMLFITDSSDSAAANSIAIANNNANSIEIEAGNDDANSIGIESTSAATSANSIAITSALNEATSTSTNSNYSQANIKETWNVMRSGPSMALLRQSKKTNHKKAETLAAPQDNTVQAAKKQFYENEEIRASERHKIQMDMWEEERTRKKVEHEKLLQLYDARIASLQCPQCKEDD